VVLALVAVAPLLLALGAAPAGGSHLVALVGRVGRGRGHLRPRLRAHRALTRASHRAAASSPPLAGAAALLGYVTQRYLVAPNTVLGPVPGIVMRVHQLVALASAVGLLVAAGVVPLALLVYWVVNATWTLAQSAVIARWFPTPGSVAAARAAIRRAGDG
jgi:YidC/Oxa1 family membrane protein insertase